MPIDRHHAFADGLAYARPKPRGFFSKSPTLLEREVEDAWRQFDSSASIGRGCLLGPSAWCINSSGDKERITLGAGVVCRGLLRVEKFGSGQIAIATSAYIGDDCLLSAAAQISIGEGAMLAHGVQIFDNDSHPLDPAARLADYALVQTHGERGAIAAKPVSIGARAWIGFNAIIMKGVTIGENSVVAAGSVVTRDVPPNSVVAGNPATIVKTIEP
jgi:acetyltransferase-like isoleucine patch superfamily enzyme